jgi:SAM-dependent methyltransferase
MDHNEAVRAQFRLQAQTFTDSGFAVAGLDWIVADLAPGGGEVVLDVAAGAAHLGRALAPHVRHVSALDLTPEMLEQGRRLAAGVPNIAFLEGDAVALPWCDAQFDLVVCRLTLHQVADPAAVVREMVRVSRGRVAVIDLTAPEDPVVAAETNRLERLRDPSHAATLTLGQVRDLLTAAGASVTSTTSHDNAVDIEDWLERTATPPAARTEIRARFAAELAGGALTGLRPNTNGTFSHVWTMTVATTT